MRTLSANMATKVATQNATTPILIVMIEWEGGTKYYGDMAIANWGGHTVLGTLISAGDISSQTKATNAAQLDSITITLDDNDGSLKQIIDGSDVLDTYVTVYLHYDGLDAADAAILVEGKLGENIVWNEEQRTVDLSIISRVSCNEVGFAPNETDLPNISKDAIDRPWPLCFGQPLKVPAVRVIKKIWTRILSPYYGTGHVAHAAFTNIDDGSEFNDSSGSEFIVAYSQFTGANKYGEIITQPVRVKCTGTVNEALKIVVWDTENDEYDTNISIGARIASDDDYDDQSVLWLDGDENLEYKYVAWTDNYSNVFINHCVKQIGKKCWFKRQFIDGTSPYLMDSGDTLDASAGFPRTAWGGTYELPENEYHPNMPGVWTLRNDGDVSNPIYIYELDNDSYMAPCGISTLIQYGSESDVYVANLVESSSILGVFAHRTINGTDTLVPVPSSYYTKNLAASLAGQTCTTVTFTIPLEDRNENWSSGVYVSLVSSIDQNIATIIEYVLDNYTNLSADAATFADLASRLAVYPCNFAVFDQPDALEFIEDIAYLSRCALRYRGTTVYLLYLSDSNNLTTHYTFDDDDILKLDAGFSSLTDVKTAITARWRSSYSDETDDYGELLSEHKLYYKANLDKYGTIEEELDVFIYNIEELVQKTLDFYGYRWSNVWRTLSIETVLTPTAIESLDIGAIDCARFSDNTIRGIVETAKYNTEGTMAFDIQLACMDTDSGGPCEDEGFWNGNGAIDTSPI